MTANSPAAHASRLLLTGTGLVTGQARASKAEHLRSASRHGVATFVAPARETYLPLGPGGTRRSAETSRCGSKEHGKPTGSIVEANSVREEPMKCACGRNVRAR